MIFDLTSSRPPPLEDSDTPEPMASLAFSPAEFVSTPIDTSLDQHPMFMYPFAAQAIAGDTDTTQYLFMDAPRAWEDGLGSWDSNDSSAPTSTTTTFDNAWSRQLSLNTDLSLAYGLSNPFDQSPNLMTQPASASFDSTILPSLHAQMSSAKKEETKCNDTGKKEKPKLIKSSSSTPWNSLLASQPHFVIAPTTRTASQMHPSSSQANPKSKLKATTGASAIQQRSHKRPIATVERDASKGEQIAKAVGLGSSDDEAENISDGGDAGGAQCKFKPALERNRMAATKCRAKAKAAVLQLEEDDHTISDRNGSLEAEVAALREQVLGLRMQLLEHGDCDCTPIQQYIQNAAELIGNTGGRHPIWGPDGHGGEWAACSPNTSGL